MADLRGDDRAISYVVEKTLAIGVAVLYIGVVTGVLLGGVVPEYRTAAGDELGERVLATAAGGVEASVPTASGDVNRTTRIELPETIRGEEYELALVGHQLRLRHPDSGISGEIRLSLADSITVANGTWTSGDALELRVVGPATNRTLRFD